MTTYYTKEHEWVRGEGGIFAVGITRYAQEQLGDVVFVETPEPGAKVEVGDDAGVVESVKAASEIYAPIDGEIVEGNESLAENPSLVNSDPEGEGWFFKIKPAAPDALGDLMDETAYKAYIEELG